MGALPREIAKGVFWIGDCQVQRVMGKVYHGYNSAFLVCGNDASCLIETGAPKDFPVIDRHIRQVLANSARPPLRYLFLTHQETPHAGSLGRILSQHPELTLHGDISDYHLAFPQYADRLRAMEIGDAIDLGGRKLVTLDSAIRDLRSTLWLFDTLEHVLFPGDGLAYSHFHTEGHCGLFAEEAETLDLKEASAVYAERALFWTKFADMKIYADELARVVEALDVRVIAPTHGLPVRDIARTMPLVMEGLLYGSEAEMTAHGDLMQTPAQQDSGE